jgi:DNA gyrase subunit A
VLIRTRVADIREMSRATQGVTLINLDEGTYLAVLEKVIESEEGAEGADGEDIEGEDGSVEGDVSGSAEAASDAADEGAAE